MQYAQDRPVNPALELNDAQRATFGALRALGPAELFHTTVARGLVPMPPDVFTVRMAHRDVFLHPGGTLRTFYAPAQRAQVLPS